MRYYHKEQPGARYYGMNFGIGAKKILWKMLEPTWPSLRDLWLWLGLVHHNQRQLYTYGFLKPGLTQHDLKQLLQYEGFCNDYLAWVDPDETLNMHKVVNTKWQYHVRLYVDGEIRGHYEYTTESHPFKHLHEVGMVDGREYLAPLLAPLLELVTKPSATPAAAPQRPVR